MDDFNEESRPEVVCRLGPLRVELGKRQRICRGCRLRIPKGTYHIAIDYGEHMASVKLCQECAESAYGWCKVSNRRNL